MPHLWSSARTGASVPPSGFTSRAGPNADVFRRATKDAIDHESPRGIPGSPGTLRDPGPGHGPGPAGPGAGPGTPRGSQAAAPQEREPDVRAITDLLASFVKAYNAKDAKALGDLFTPDAEIEDEDGEVTRGRDAIVERFSGIFEENDGGTLAVDTDSLRFLGTDRRHRGGHGVALDRAGRPRRARTGTA